MKFPGTLRNLEQTPALQTAQRASSLLTRFFAVDSTLAAAGLAFYLMLAIVPLLVTAAGIFGLLFGTQTLDTALQTLANTGVASMSDLEPAKQALLKQVAQTSASALTVGSVGTLFAATWASSKIVASTRRLLDSMNQDQLRRSTLRDRIHGALVTLTIIVILVAVLIAALAAPFLTSNIPALTHLAVPALVVITTWSLAYATIARLPVTAPPAGLTAPGVIAATIANLAAVGGFGLYVRWTTSLGPVFVVFGTAVALLIWAYLMFIGLLAGGSIQAALIPTGGTWAALKDFLTGETPTHGGDEPSARGAPES